MKDREIGYQLPQEYFHIKLIGDSEMIIEFSKGIEDEIKEYFPFLEIFILQAKPKIKTIVNSFGNRHKDIISYHLKVGPGIVKSMEDIFNHVSNISIIKSLKFNDQ